MKIYGVNTCVQPTRNLKYILSILCKPTDRPEQGQVCGPTYKIFYGSRWKWDEQMATSGALRDP